MKKYFQLAVLMSLSLGLAPFYPHAHIWKQLKNLWLDRPMNGMDWFDLFLHGFPWFFLIIVSIATLQDKFKRSKNR